MPSSLHAQPSTPSVTAPISFMKQTSIALVGAGGKMGCRLTDNFLKCADYALHYLEISPKGLENLKSRGVTVSNELDAVPSADVVILAVPDVAIGAISRQIVPQMKPGA